MLVEIALNLPTRLAELMNRPSSGELAPKLAIAEVSTWAALASIDWMKVFWSLPSVTLVRMLATTVVAPPVALTEEVRLLSASGLGRVPGKLNLGEGSDVG